MLVPTRMHELVMVALRIKNQLQFYLAIGRLVAAVPPNHLFAYTYDTGLALPLHNNLRLYIIHEITHLVIPQGVLDKLQCEETIIRVFWDGQIEHTLRVFLQEGKLVITVLADSEVEFIDGGYSNKALDFDRDLFAIFLGSNELLSTQINVHLYATDLEGQRIVRDAPTCFL